jgi:hypothetical protein
MMRTTVAIEVQTFLMCRLPQSFSRKSACEYGSRQYAPAADHASDVVL